MFKSIKFWCLSAGLFLGCLGVMCSLRYHFVETSIVVAGVMLFAVCLVIAADILS